MERQVSWYLSAGKRWLDVVLSILLMPLVGPCMVLLAGVIRLILGAPVFFRQERAGQSGRPFLLLKFRTMTDARDAMGQLLSDAERLTPLGRFLRRTSLDELPGLLNVLKGEMSFVGPRPLHLRYLERYSPEQARRHDVPVGITGWAQIHGRNAISWEQKFALDVWYVDHLGLWLDLKIMAATIWYALRRKDINAPGHATTQEFMGSQP